MTLHGRKQGEQLGHFRIVDIRRVQRDISGRETSGRIRQHGRIRSQLDMRVGEIDVKSRIQNIRICHFDINGSRIANGCRTRKNARLQ